MLSMTRTSKGTFHAKKYINFGFKLGGHQNDKKVLLLVQKGK